MRVLLAVLHTVFSRVDAAGEPYKFFEVDKDRLVQISAAKENNIEDYEDALYDTWIDIWEKGEFPDVVCEYLEKWRDRFYLYDDKYPFFQVTKEVIEKDTEKKGAEKFYGKNINRLISESQNKIALFSPKDETTKEYILDDEVTRWLITFQGYSGGFHSKARSFGDKLPSSYGWLYALGGIFLQGSNLFETLMLNFAIAHNENNNLLKIQKPCWEMDTMEEYIDLYFHNGIDNIAGLYTEWSKEVFINPSHNENTDFYCNITMLPAIETANAFLEPMTLWEKNKKDGYTPKVHEQFKSMWRNFGLVTGVELVRKPGIMDWLNNILDNISDSNALELNKKNISVCALSMKIGGTATSKIPVDEIYDTLNMQERVLVDTGKDGWIIRINGTIKYTKDKIDGALKLFLSDLADIRNINKSKNKKATDEYINKYLEGFYSAIDWPFRQWIESIDINDKKDEKDIQWQDILKNSMVDYVNEIVSNATLRDYKGVEIKYKNKKIYKNIATAYNLFESNLIKKE